MFRNMKIGKKLIVSFVAISLLASIAGIIGLIVTINTDSNYSHALVVNGFSQGDIGEFNTYLNKDGAVLRDIIFLTDAAESKASQQELEEIRATAAKALAAFKVTCQTSQEFEQLAIIEENYPLYQQKCAEVIQLSTSGQSNEALLAFRNNARPLLATCMAAAENLADINTALGNEVSDSLTANTQISIVGIAAVIIAALVISILLGAYIARSISRPIKDCSERLLLLAKGDLHSPVPLAESTDEAGLMLSSLKTTTETIQLMITDIDKGLGEMARGNLDINSTAEFYGDFIAIERSIDRIAQSLNDTLGQINQAAEQVSSGSDQVSSGAQALSQGATEQASSVEELAATIEEISGQVKSNAENAQAASKQAVEAGDAIVVSNQKMQNMISAMNTISGKSSQIGKIIKTIEDIAFQTNILALNAAVEAARAGAAGKGFAVVADEVRNLASKSADAAKNTTALIEESIQAVASGTVIVDETANAMHSVMDGAQKIAVWIDSIAKASGDQASSISQVTMGVDQISSVVQTNSATAQQSAAASEELSSQALMLKKLVSQFHIKSGPDTALQDFGGAAPMDDFGLGNNKY